MSVVPKLSWNQRMHRRGWWRLGRANPHEPLNSPDQIRGLHRLIRVIDDDTIELRNFMSSIRWLWLFTAILIIGGWVWSGPMTMNVPPLPRPLLGLVAPEWYGEWQTATSESHFPGGQFPDSLDRAESVRVNAQAAREEWKAGIVFLILFAVPPLYWLFAPGPRGVRVDRRRKLVYGWKGFRFYCIKIHDFDLIEIDAHYTTRRGPEGEKYGHLVWGLPRADRPEKIGDFLLGRGPTPNWHQFTLMHNAAGSFLWHKEDPDWLVKRKTTPRGRNNWIDWLAAIASFHLIPAIWPPSTERRLQQFDMKSRE
ncbi:hypothetical protein [Rhodovulum sulfidophilum]|uniref:hypothetical protein n=1 Tax=Rhodovulum sulfidophilum TaxID=35806 RepID=UPI001F40BE66|nr:hypothetical protein [Rhodovulum sulfidophilum]MCE8440761.1 hypothetical protein [Rhodovulum sulfidophilum]MCE8468384.1 hypothetical protein [Rhodovulum sulfidophilum]